jgi:RNA polymerase sigma factor (sigma-70 family)
VSSEDLDRTIGHLLREIAPQVLGAIARRHGDLDTAEDAVQEALIAAAQKWPRDGIPQNPRGWVYQVALRRLTDQTRSEVARRRREEAVALDVSGDDALAPSPDEAMGVREDDSLLLLFMCCHPSLSSASAIALTLHAVGGLTTREIANAFLAPEATMAQRISRAKQSIKSSKIPFTMPGDAERAARLASVLHVLYLIFNEGYASSVGSTLSRTDLSSEAIRLTRGLKDLLPHEPEVAGLLALMLLTDSRRLARTGKAGELIPLDEQDRSLWNQEQIREGIEIVSSALPQGRVGYYQLQAAVAAVHAEAARVEDTDWPQILALYSVLLRLADNPMVRVSHAIAAAMVHGPARGLELLETLDSDSRMQRNHRLDAVRGHLLEMAGDLEGALHHYRIAASRTGSIPERDYLNLKGARLVERMSAPSSGRATS